MKSPQKQVLDPKRVKLDHKSGFWRLVSVSPPPLLAGTPKPGFGRKLFPKAHFEPTGLVFPEEGKKNPERGFTGGGYPPWFSGKKERFFSAGGYLWGVEPPDQIRNCENLFAKTKKT